MAAMDIVSLRRVHEGAPGTETASSNDVFPGNIRILWGLGYY